MILHMMVVATEHLNYQFLTQLNINYNRNHSYFCEVGSFYILVQIFSSVYLQIIAPLQLLLTVYNAQLWSKDNPYWTTAFCTKEWNPNEFVYSFILFIGLQVIKWSGLGTFYELGHNIMLENVFTVKIYLCDIFQLILLHFS